MFAEVSHLALHSFLLRLFLVDALQALINRLRVFRCGQERVAITKLEDALSHLPFDRLRDRHDKVAEETWLLNNALSCQIKRTSREVYSCVTEHHSVEDWLRLHREFLQPINGPIVELKDLGLLSPPHLAHNKEIIERNAAICSRLVFFIIGEAHLLSLFLLLALLFTLLPLRVVVMGTHPIDQCIDFALR